MIVVSAGDTPPHEKSNLRAPSSGYSHTVTRVMVRRSMAFVLLVVTNLISRPLGGGGLGRAPGRVSKGPKDAGSNSASYIDIFWHKYLLEDHII